MMMVLKNAIVEKYLYIAISIACISLATLRPFGITHDDENYQWHAEHTCKISECGLEQELHNYDVGYFFLLSIAIEFFDSYQAVLFLAGLALAIKLALIARMTSYSLLSLYFYFSVFFLYHDVTQVRASMAIALFLWALYLMGQEQKKLGVFAYGAAMLTHTQAVIAPLAQMTSKVIRHRYRRAIIWVLVSQIAIAIHLVPASSIINLIIREDSFRLSELFIDQSLMGIKGTNVLIILLLALTVIPLKRMSPPANLLAFCFASVVIGYVFYWLFAGIHVLSDRILQFFWVPLAILVSLGKLHKPTYIATVLVGSMFFMLTAYIAPILES